MVRPGSERGYKTGGRKKGTPNRTTAEMRDAILEAFDRAGGVDYLVRQADTNPQTFLALLGRVLPREAKIDATIAASHGQLVGASSQIPKAVVEAALSAWRNIRAAEAQGQSHT